MKPDYEKQLEAAIGRQLSGLPEIPAPATLIPRVLHLLERRARSPWYRQGWQRWPAPLRACSFVMLAALSGGFCFAVWQLCQAESLTLAMHEFGGWFSGLDAVWSTLSALAGACALVLRQLGPGFVVAALTMVALTYMACVGLGTAFFRFTFARERN